MAIKGSSPTMTMIFDAYSWAINKSINKYIQLPDQDGFAYIFIVFSIIGRIRGFEKMQDGDDAMLGNLCAETK